MISNSEFTCVDVCFRPLLFYLDYSYNMGKCVASSSLPPVRLWGHRRAVDHAKRCDAKKCSKCLWANKGRQWRLKFPWLRFGRSCGPAGGSSFGLGCSACAMFQHMRSTGALSTSLGRRPLATPCRCFGRKGSSSDSISDKAEFETFTVALRLKTWQLERHQQSQKHRDAVNFLQGHVNEEDLLTAPSAQEFGSMLSNMQKGHSMRDGGSASDRTSFMQWCLSESLLDIWRQKMAKATTACFIRDERKGKLLIRFRSADETLDLCSGVLGQIRMKGGSAEDIVAATAKALKIFCTRLFLPPRMGKALAPQGGFDRDLFRHVRKITNILTTDCHPAELLASNIMRGHRASADPAQNLDPFLPNIVLVGRDSAHASTRLVKRPWACVPCIQVGIAANKCFGCCNK